MIKVYLYPVRFMIAILKQFNWLYDLHLGICCLFVATTSVIITSPNFRLNPDYFYKGLQFTLRYGRSLPSVVQWYCYWNFDPEDIIICYSSVNIVAVSTHLPPSKMVAVSQTTYWKEFSWMKCFVYLFEFPWSLFLRVQLTISQRCFM